MNQKKLKIKKLFLSLDLEPVLQENSDRSYYTIQ